MATQDSQFANRLTLIIGTMVVVALALVFLSRGIASSTVTDDLPVAAAPR